MNKTFSFLTLQLCLLFFLGIISCNKDHIEPTLNFRIESIKGFEIISQHENGWVKEAKKYNESREVIASFEYHPNGYLKYYNSYSSINDYGTYISIERDENNLPILSEFYLPDGSFQLINNYENGVLINQLLTEDSTVTESTYTDGKLIKSRMYDMKSTVTTMITYDYVTGTRSIAITIDGTILSAVELPLVGKLGAGANSASRISLANYIGLDQYNVSNVNTFSATSLIWETKVEPLSYIPAPVVFDKWTSRSSEFAHVKFIATSPIFRNIVEQYPFVESETLISGVRIVQSKYSVYPENEKKEAIWTELDQNKAQFFRLYGDEFNSNHFTGKYVITAATLRNLPSDKELREEVKDIAWKRATYLISGIGEDLLPSEENMLSNVFFELKVHSLSLKDAQGVVINSHDDYIDAMAAIEKVPNEIIQKGFTNYEKVALIPTN